MDCRSTLTPAFFRFCDSTITAGALRWSVGYSSTTFSPL